MRIAFGYVSGFVALCGLGLGAVAQSVDAPEQATTTAPASQVRIVRLSEVREMVQLDRNTGQGYEKTLANMPIVQGSRLRTQQGWAEVEFEDNSSLRITPHSAIAFTTLGRTAAGTTTNTLTLEKGTLYLSLTKTKGNDFVVKVAGETITLPPSSHIRLDVYPAGNELYVFQGHADVVDATGTFVIGKDRSLSFGAPGEPEPVVARDRRPGLYDNWDRTAVAYHEMRANGVGGFAFGQQDLNYYGAYTDVDGCGRMWQPYFTSAAFDPFANGVWAYYPGAGYSFVSPYPWGWLPFHTGSWQNCGGRWGWQQGSAWTGLVNHSILRPVKGPIGIHPIHPPAKGSSSLIVVGEGKLAVSHLAGDRFQFTKDSAGFGVPRTMLGKLGKYSSQVAAHGMATTPVQVQEVDSHDELASLGAGPVARPGASGAGPASRPVMTGGGPAHASGGGFSGGSVSAGGGSFSSSHASSSSSTPSSSSSSSTSSSSGGSHH